MPCRGDNNKSNVYVRRDIVYQNAHTRALSSLSSVSLTHLATLEPSPSISQTTSRLRKIARAGSIAPAPCVAAWAGSVTTSDTFVAPCPEPCALRPLAAPGLLLPATALSSSEPTLPHVLLCPPSAPWESELQLRSMHVPRFVLYTTPPAGLPRSSLELVLTVLAVDRFVANPRLPS